MHTEQENKPFPARHIIISLPPIGPGVSVFSGNFPWHKIVCKNRSHKRIAKRRENGKSRLKDRRFQSSTHTIAEEDFLNTKKKAVSDVRDVTSFFLEVCRSRHSHSKSVLGNYFLQTALAHFPSDDIAKWLHEISGNSRPIGWLEAALSLPSFIYLTAKWQIYALTERKCSTFIWPSCKIFPPETGSAAGWITKCVIGVESSESWKFQGRSPMNF